MSTEYAECPECLHDGPHRVIHGTDQLECGLCHVEFPNPFVDEPILL